MHNRIDESGYTWLDLSDVGDEEDIRLCSTTQGLLEAVPMYWEIPKGKLGSIYLHIGKIIVDDEDTIQTFCTIIGGANHEAVLLYDKKDNEQALFMQL